MLVSLKELIHKQKASSGIFTFNEENPPTLIVTNRQGEEVSSYNDLKEVELTPGENDFATKNWEKVVEEHPKFYDGEVTAVIDVIYDPRNNSLSFVMEKMRYSRVCAMQTKDYPEKTRYEDFVSFGIGLMSNLQISPDGSFLMVERSQKVHTEKGAISVPGGSLEYKYDKEEKIVLKDDIANGFEKAALEEVSEEILGALDPETMKVSLQSIDWTRDKDGLTGLGANFTVKPAQHITRREVYKGFKGAKDQDESTGKFFFVNPAANGTGENNLYATPQDIMNEMECGSRKLQGSGTAALTTEVDRRLKEDYAKGLYAGIPPSQDGIASHFSDFSIFDLFRVCKANMSSRDIVPSTKVYSKEVSNISVENEKEMPRS